MNAYLAVLPLPQVSPHSFPYTVQDPETGQRIQINNVEDYWNAVEGFKTNRFIYAELIGDTRHLVDHAAQMDLERYLYAKEWGVSPFPGAYDDQPAVWIDKTKIISNALHDAQKIKAARDGQKFKI